MICTNFDNALKRLQSSNTTNSSGQLGPSSSATNARNASSHSFAPSSLVPIKRRLQVGSSDSHGSTSRREDNVPDNNTASTSTSLSTVSHIYLLFVAKLGGLFTHYKLTIATTKQLYT